MTVFKPVVMVDEIRKWPHARTPFRMGSCHLTVDGETPEHLAELHGLAKRIGCEQSWFQPHKIHPHYDLTPSKRTEAILAGAVEIDAIIQARARLIRHGLLPADPVSETT